MHGILAESNHALSNSKIKIHYLVNRHLSRAIHQLLGKHRFYFYGTGVLASHQDSRCTAQGPTQVTNEAIHRQHINAPKSFGGSEPIFTIYFLIPFT